ncbi:MAG TPA: polymer-forming cytoskeletal protein [Alphaproteobacteria bacterium]|nr:polymer-forming cytoskeletal protein [Alphaproteobacteria bacterium]
MFGRKKPEDQTRAALANESGGNGATGRIAPSFGSAGSLSLRKPAPAKPVAGRESEIPGVAARRPDPLRGTALAQDHKTLIVARDIAIAGAKIGPCERLLVEGQLDAAVGDCREIEVARGASFKGAIHVEDADIAGSFDGEMIVRRRLRIRASGRLKGRISYGHIEIEPGGQIDGEVSRLQPVLPAGPAAEVAPVATPVADDEPTRA